MTRSLIPLAALALLLGACSSTQSAQNAQPVPAKSAGTANTRWGNLPVYTSEEGGPIVFNWQGMPTPRRSYSLRLDLLVERDGTVREVDVRRSSGMANVDAAVAAKLKEARSRLVLAPGDAAPYVIRYLFDQQVDVASANSSPYNDYRFIDDRPMGTGQPLATDRRP